MSEVEHALAQIADIRAQLAATTRFRGYAPEAVGMVGVMSLGALLLELVWPRRFAASDGQLVMTWGLLLAAGCLAIAIEAIVRTLRANDRLASSMLFGALRVVVPGSVIALVVPFAVLAHAPQVSWIVPGVWQMLIGFVAFASWSSMPRGIVWPAAWYLGTGALGVFLAGSAGELSPLVVGLPFVVGHFAIAWVLMDKERCAHG